MKSTAWLSVVILVAVILSVAFSWFLSSPDRDYLFDGERGISRPEVANWWRIRIPMALSLGTIIGGTLIVLSRTARSRAWLESVACIAVAVLGVSTVAGSLFFVRQSAEAKPIECVLPTPGSPNEVFTEQQWLVLSVAPKRGGVPVLVDVEDRMGPLRKGGVGLENFQGRIPYDPFLLDRISFLGLTYDEVEVLLGLPVPTEVPDSPSIRYYMRGFHYPYQSATLTLSFGRRWERSDTVVAQHLRQH